MRDNAGFSSETTRFPWHSAALRHGRGWLDSLLLDLQRNRALLGRLLAAQLPKVGWRPGEATYLAWLDWRALGLGDDPAAELVERARVALTPGAGFGPEGNGFARLNFATNPDLIAEAVRRIAAALG